VSYQDGQIIVRVALELGPFDEPTEPDWTDLTDRVLAYRDERGRDDVLQPFGAGTAMVTLDNGDRMLDPSNPDGLLFDGVDPIGLPLCPVKITQWWDGAEYPKFTGVLGPEAWPGDIASKGNTGTVALHVVDALGHSPQLPPDAWGITIASLHPEWWSRMDDLGFPVLDDESPVPNSIGSDFGEVEGTTGISRPFHAGLVNAIGIFSPGLLLAGDHQVRIPATSIMPDGDEDKFTAMCWWSSRDEMVSGDAYVMRMVNPSSGVMRWSVYVDSADGKAYVTTYDATETVVDSDVIDGTSFVGRWDEGDGKHLVIAKWDAGVGNNLTVWFGGISATLSIPGDLYESDLILGPGNGTVDSLFDEVATWRDAFDYLGTIAPILLSGADLSWWAGHTFSDRLGAWIETTGRSVTVDDSNEWHIPVGLTESLWGLVRQRTEIDFGPGTYSAGRATLPANLAEAFRITVESGGGVCWATKANRLRARIMDTLYDSTWDADYNTPVLFTDEDATLSAGEFRHAGVELTGKRIERVINDATVNFLYSDQEPPDIMTAAQIACRARDSESITRYGKRTWEIDSEWADWPLNQTLAERVVERFAQPRQEIESIRLDPLGDDSLAEWLITTCELELACDVTYTPAAGDPVTVEGLNIQHISFDWTPERWSVDLVAAAS